MEKSKNVGETIGRLPYDKNAKKQGKGITLIALIITIIVMLILVGVSVAILINSNMIGIAQDAANRTKTSYEDESNIGEFEAGGQKYNSIDEYLGTKEEKLPEINAGERATNNSEYTDKNGDKA